VKVTPILRDKRRRHPKGKDVECHESLLALDHFTMGAGISTVAATAMWRVFMATAGHVEISSS